nr:hypothetical protein [Campylobacter jejuni]
MHNPNSAIERIKNHLAYKLGKVMIDFSHQRNNYKYGGGYIALFKNLSTNHTSFSSTQISKFRNMQRL